MLQAIAATLAKITASHSARSILNSPYSLILGMGRQHQTSPKNNPQNSYVNFLHADALDYRADKLII
jgi:hypothetical protein